MQRFQNLGIIKNEAMFDVKLLKHFSTIIQNLKQTERWSKEQLVELFFEMIPNFEYVEKGKYLDEKM